MRPHLKAIGALALSFVVACSAHAQSFSTVRDAEIEHTLRRIATPLLDVAGLRSGDVRLILVQDRTLNAFVARGQNIFIHTGLLTEAVTAGEVAGVLAHEIGHISGGHLARLPEALENLEIQNFIALILGAAAGALSGNAEVGAGVLTGAQSSALRTTLAYTRQQESSADQAALRYLDAVGWSAAGFSRFMSKLGFQEGLYTSSQDPYFRTHPLSRGRVSAIESHIQRRSRLSEPPSAFEAALARARAKIIGYFDGRVGVGRRYPIGDDSDAALLARAYAAFRVSDLGAARSLGQQLVTRGPNNPFNKEFLGDILLSGGDAAGAARLYREAAAMAPDQPLLRFSLGRALLQIGTDASARQAADAFNAGLRGEPDNPGAWRSLSIALGRNGDFGRADLAFAESAFLIGDFQSARSRAERALGQLPAGTPARLKAQDLIQAVDAKLNRRR